MLGCGLVIMIGHMQLQNEVLLQFWLLRDDPQEPCAATV